MAGARRRAGSHGPNGIRCHRLSTPSMVMPTSSRSTCLARALAMPLSDPDVDSRAAASEVDRLWRTHGGDWRDGTAVTVLLAGVAQLAWRCARSGGGPVVPPFAVELAARPRCVRILLPDDSRHFGIVIVWLRHFESLLPCGAPTCELVLAPRAGATVVPCADLRVWGCPPSAGAPRGVDKG
jgi:hypothetical protein